MPALNGVEDENPPVLPQLRAVVDHPWQLEADGPQSDLVEDWHGIGDGQMTKINGVPFPKDVKDEETFLSWLSSIERESENAVDTKCLTEAFHLSHFKNEDDESERVAKRIVCQNMAIDMFSHLIHAPKGKIFWRIRPEFDVSVDTIPSDLSLVMNRSQIEKELGNPPIKNVSLVELKKAIGRPDWAVDFVTDTIFPAAANLGEWRIFKAYMRYSVVVDGEIIFSRYRTNRIISG